jgi:DNA-binding GntR family transcriptional regulator
MSHAPRRSRETFANMRALKNAPAVVAGPRPAAGARPMSARAIAGLIKDRITRGEYEPGRRLVEADLMTETGGGRSRVRETLRTLVGEGYLVFEENRGVRVRRLSRAEATEIGRVREVLEGLAVRQTVENGLSREDKKVLGDLQKRLNAAINDRDLASYNRHSTLFHDFFFERARNSYLATLGERMRPPMLRIQFRSVFTEDGMAVRNEHKRRVTAAALAGDAAAAETEMRRYIDAGNRALAACPDSHFE